MFHLDTSRRRRTPRLGGQYLTLARMSKVMDVIVIGCGASGIAALRRLHEAGLKTLGLEAADRIGGRINTVPFADGAIDLGAAWCQGEKDNVVYDMIKDMNVLGRSETGHRWFVVSDGSLVPNEKAESIENTLFAAVDAADRNTTASLSEYVRQVANKIDVLQKEPSLKNSFVEWFERYNHVSGQTDSKTGKSLRGFEEFTPWEFMLNWKGKGYRTILDILLKKYPNPSEEIPVEILLNKEVETIKWKSSQSDVSIPLVHVKCKDGSLYAAKSVIVTVSVGVLKERHQQLFNPPLPAEKVNSINNLEMCVLGKIYMEFEEPWWPKSPANFTLLWKPEDKDKFTKEEKWITEVYNLNTVDYQPKVLMAWTYGEGAERMEKLSLKEVKAGMTKLLDIVLGKQFNITPIKSVVRSQWGCNPLARGSYSYRSIASEETGADGLILREPLYLGEEYPIVCFGGEATTPFKYSSVQAAVEAGFREADRIIKHFSK